MAEALTADLKDLLNSGTGDILVRFSDGEAHAHALILSARSKVLRAELSVPMIEAATKTIAMDCCACTGLAFLSFLYTGHLETEWMTSIAEFRMMAVLVDFYSVSGFEAALGRRVLRAFTRNVRLEIPQHSDDFWSDLVALLPLLPEKARRALLGTYVRENITWGHDVFLALCVATAGNCADVEEQCMREVSVKFSMGGCVAPRGHVQALEADDHSSGFREEFAEARIAECVGRTSTEVVLRAFIKFQASVVSILSIRQEVPEVKVPNTPGWNLAKGLVLRGAQRFNATQCATLASLTGAAADVLRLASEPQPPRPSPQEGAPAPAAAGQSRRAPPGRPCPSGAGAEPGRRAEGA
uniref:BTB domain-containing protein n=1 Tax=Alexandrium catenella TaxID=2925 RepID=A0A7S1S215_ALECA